MVSPVDRHEAVIELAMPARPEVVSVARLVVGALVAADPAFDEERGADVRLAVSEACTNAIEAERHGDHGTEPAPLVVRCAVSAGTLEFSVQDHGQGFDPDDLEEHPEVTSLARLDHESGLGIPLMRLLSDHVEFDAGPQGTTVTMIFHPRRSHAGNRFLHTIGA